MLVFIFVLVVMDSEVLVIDGKYIDFVKIKKFKVFFMIFFKVIVKV